MNLTDATKVSFSPRGHSNPDLQKSHHKSHSKKKAVKTNNEEIEQKTDIVSKESFSVTGTFEFLEINNLQSNILLNDIPQVSISSYQVDDSKAGKTKGKSAVKKINLDEIKSHQSTEKICNDNARVIIEQNAGKVTHRANSLTSSIPAPSVNSGRMRSSSIVNSSGQSPKTSGSGHPSPEGISPTYLLPRGIELKYNNFFQGIGDKMCQIPIKLCGYHKDENPKKFDKELMHHLKTALVQKCFSNTVSVTSPRVTTLQNQVNRTALENQIYGFCRDTINTAFLKDNLDINQYRKSEPDRIIRLLEIIQNSGILIRELLPNLILLHKELCEHVSKNQKTSFFAIELYDHLSQLIESDEFHKEEYCFHYGKKIYGFLEVLNGLSSLTLGKKNKQETSQSFEEQKIKTKTFGWHDQSLISPSHLIAMAFGNGSIEEGGKLIKELFWWGIPVEGGTAPACDLLRTYCRDFAFRCSSVADLPLIEHRCHVEHFCRREIEQRKHLHLPTSSLTSSSESKFNLSLFDGIPPTLAQLAFAKSGMNKNDYWIDQNGSTLFNTSYARNPIAEVGKSLNPKNPQFPNSIIINKEVIYSKDFRISILPSLKPFRHTCQMTVQRPEVQFWVDFFSWLYSHNFYNGAKPEEILEQAIEMAQYIENPEFVMALGNQINPPDLFEKIPCLQVGVLMTQECEALAIQYIKLLFPKLFLPMHNDSKLSYYPQYPAGFSEIRICIDGPENFKVTQKNIIELSLDENGNDVVAKLTYLWTNSACPSGTIDPSSLNKGCKSKVQNGWVGCLTLECDVQDGNHFDPIMDCLTFPTGVNDLANLPKGLNYSKRIRVQSRTRMAHNSK